LKTHTDLPQFVLDIETPGSLGVLAAEQQTAVPELEGDLEGFELVDLNAEDMAEYRYGKLFFLLEVFGKFFIGEFFRSLK
jgi:hypothetical protein